MPLRVELSRSAERELDNLDEHTRQSIMEKLLEMQSEPYRSAVKLAGRQSYRVRVSDWRVIFRVSGEVVVIERVGHRRDIYKRL